MHRAKMSKQAKDHCSDRLEQPRNKANFSVLQPQLQTHKTRQFTKWLGFQKNKREMDMKSP